MPAVDPPERPGARPFEAWTLDDEGWRVTVYWGVESLWRPRLFSAEEPRAVYLTVVAEPWPDGLHQAAVWFGTPSLTARLREPLGNRPVIDATAGVARPRLASPPDYDYFRGTLDSRGRRRRSRGPIRPAS